MARFTGQPVGTELLRTLALEALDGTRSPDRLPGPRRLFRS